MIFPCDFQKIAINNMTVARETNFKFLGIHFDENMTWEYHIAEVEKKISAVAGMICKTRSFLNTKTLKMLLDSMAQSHINYANTVWASTYKTKFQRIFIKQKQISRMILFQSRNSHSRPLMTKLKALNVFQINLFQTLTLMYK